MSRMLPAALAVMTLSAVPVSAQDLLSIPPATLAGVSAAAVPGAIPTVMPIAPAATTTSASAAAAEADQVPLWKQVPDKLESDFKRPSSLMPMYFSYAALQALDMHSTMSAMKAGAHEANPTMAGVVKNPGAFAAVKIGVAAATIFATERMWKRNKAAAIAVMVIANGVNAAVVMHNYRVARSLSR